MAGFLYIVPDLITVTKETLPPALKPVLDKSTWMHCRIHNGPGGLSGMIIVPDCPQGEAPPVGYYPEQQTWFPHEEKLPEGGTKITHWVGVMKDRMPTPRDLFRGNSTVETSLITIDDHKWAIPILHVPNSMEVSPYLPYRFHRIGGEYVQTLEEQYQLLTLRSVVWCALIFGETTEINFTRADEIRYLVDLLAVSYRIGETEASILGMLSNKSIIDAANASIGLVKMAQELELKKKDIEQSRA
jgi:hypothetical protein